MNWKVLYASGSVSCHDAPGYEYYTELRSVNWTSKHSDELDDAVVSPPEPSPLERVAGRRRCHPAVP